MSQLHVYETLRYVMALLCGLTAWRLRVWYFAASAIALIVPQSLYNPIYWRAEWLPMEALRLILAVDFTISLIKASSHKAILTRERDMLFLFGLAVGLSFVAASWLWIPLNGFQAAITARQYCYLILAVLVTCWCVWVRYIRPAMIPLHYDYQALMWSGWLWFSVLMASGGKGGLLWTVTQWKGNAVTWYAVGDIGMMAQMLIAACLLAFHACEATA